MRREGKFPINKKSFRREIGMMAKEVGIPTDELLEFVKPLLKEAFNECFEPGNVKNEDKG
jgi:hypothetical protein